MTIIRIIFSTLMLIVVGGFLALSTLDETIRPAPEPVKVSGFTEIPAGFAHKWSRTTHPFTGAAVIDVDGDGAPEIFVGGGEGQDDALLRYRDGKLVADSPDAGLSVKAATYGATAIDLDRDGDADLIVARNNGVYLHLNEGGRFSARKLPIDFGPGEVPFTVAVADIDGDGDGDLYVSVFVSFAEFRSAVFNDPEHAKKNRLLRNNGDLTFTDITESSGTASKQNTFTSAFADLDGDAAPDLIVSQNTGEVEIFRNLGGGRFEPKPTNTGYGFWMGLAIGDVDGDGDQDLFFSNLGVSIPAFLTTGDLREDQRHAPEWLLLRNDGGFKFTDVTAQYGLTGYGFAWGAVFEDLNLDGRLDLAVAQNYIKWPPHKILPLGSKAFVQQAGDGEPGFYQADAFGLDNRYFAQSPLIADLNSDGRPDFLWLNMDGPLRAFLNTSKNNFLTVAIPDTLAFLGASVVVETQSGAAMTRQVTGSLGFLTDQTPSVFFGLGRAEKVTRVRIKTAYGKTFVADAPPVNATLQISDFTPVP